ncbi:MAG: hypothetical protein GY938_10895 [Ketobacter sp.]|nr:hypothetical protein [Ketobacter sp.]
MDRNTPNAFYPFNDASEGANHGQKHTHAFYPFNDASVGRPFCAIAMSANHTQAGNTSLVGGGASL